LSEEPTEKTAKGKKRRFSIRKILGITLIVAGLALLLYVPATWLWGYIVQRNLPGEFDRETAAALPLNQDVLNGLKGAADAEKLKELAIAFQSRLTHEQTIAKLEIPKIGVNAIVVEGTDDAALRKGPGHLEETGLPGMTANFSVAGDRVLWGGPFLNLDDVSEGDQVIVTTTYGRFEYEVYHTDRIVPEDVSVLQPTGEEIITLITCDPPWDTSHRLIVQARCTNASLLNESS
jgi:sortase A